MKFWKINGAGNDFIIINNVYEKIPKENFATLARKLCDRRMSIGADGLMLVERASGSADYRMVFYNSDGSQGEMCGNGARCICRYGYETGLAGETQAVETTAGLVTGRRISERTYRIRLNDPAVCRLDEEVTVKPGEAYVRFTQENCSGELRFLCSYVELGNPGIPHCVVEIKGLQDRPREEVAAIGRMLRSYEGYPKGANVNFYDIIGIDHVYECTFERGVEDLTYACGTGTGSTALVLTKKKLVSGKNVIFDMKGGRLSVDINMPGDKAADIFLTGPTNIVAKGEVFDEDLLI